MTYTKLHYQNGDSNADFGLDMRFINSSGSEVSTSNYDRAKYYMPTSISFGEVQGNQSKLYR